jgi:phosphate:Na+ symporter
MDSGSAVQTISVSALCIGLIGGLSLFLYGMEQMTTSMKVVAGGGMKTLLSKMTSNRFKAAATGAFVTAVVNSSSVTTVLVVGFISAGLISLTQSIGIIMGANIGSTITAQVIAFKVTKYSLVLIAAGYIWHMAARNEKHWHYGTMLMGLGLLFFGMSIMSDATKPLRSYQPFIDLMKMMDAPILGMMIGAAFTAVIQSSGATTGIIIVLASQGFVTLDAGIALAFGANIGTCATALLASIGKPRAAIQAAAVHILFNVAGCLLWLFFIPYLAAFVRFFSPTSPELDGIARLAAETPRQIANAHTLFNIANTFIFIGLVKPIARIVEYLVPIIEEPEPEIAKPKYLDDALIGTPDLALDRVRMELVGMGERTLNMVVRAIPVVMRGDKAEIETIPKMDDDIDALHEAILDYIRRVSQEDLTERHQACANNYMACTNYFENIGDTLEINLCTMARDRLKLGVEIGEKELDILLPIVGKVKECLYKVVRGITDSDADMMESVVNEKYLLRKLVNDAKAKLIENMTGHDKHSVHTYRILLEAVENLRRCFYFTKKIAKSELKYISPEREKAVE